MRISANCSVLGLISGALAAGICAFAACSVPARAVAEELVLRGTLYEAGDFRVGERIPNCGRARTILTADLGDYGASIGAFIILNPQKLDRLSAATRLFVYSHECAHQLYGPGEERADCYAAKRGKAEGWLQPSDIDAVCRIFPHKSRSAEHPDRAARCAAIQACYASATRPTSAPSPVATRDGQTYR
ncbi:hypothetical protein [Microbaculum marinum]|uniref:IrrE N-terminal-like domain-containing protein n=1 Tax=Microbaculum marinum TaxID=1764581 RepID=A0AAW9RE54_9HYPH